jgi:hypothetical protein
LKNRILIVIVLFWAVCLNAQKELVINELDCDTPGLDTQEFIELRSIKPNFPLDGFVLVFFNGSSSGGNSCYLAIDLDGYQTDVNGIFLIGPSTLIPFPHYIIPENTIQNGEDAVAIYKGDETDFPIGKVAFFDTRLIDVLIYGTSDPDAVSMIQIFKALTQIFVKSMKAVPTIPTLYKEKMMVRIMWAPLLHVSSMMAQELF